MAINFPSNPSTNDTYTVNGRTYIWTGEKWRRRRPRIEYTPPTMDVSNDFTAGSSLKVDSDNSSVGIGTMTPNADDALTVSGHTTITDGIVVDTDTLVVDATNDRVGINNTTPAQALDVTGNIAVSGTVDGRDVATDGTKLDGIETGADVTDATNVESAIEAITLTSVSGDTGDEVLIVDATDGGLKAVLWENLSSGGGTPGGSDGQVQYNNGGEFGGSSGLYYDDVNSRVGIGTTSPTGMLHVSGSDPKIWLTDTDTNADSYVSASSSVGSLILSADENNEVGSSQIALKVDGSDKMNIQSTGNVGIGTTSPAYKLDVDAGSDGNILRLKGANDTLNFTVSAGDFSILNSQQSNGIVIYDGTGGVEIFYNGSAVLEADNGGVKVGGSRILTVADEGSGNGLDADTLDGSHASAFATSGHTHSYLSTSGGQITGDLTIRESSPTVVLRDTDHRSGMIHMNSNLMYFLRGSGTDSTSWSTVNGAWPLYLDMTNNNAFFGGNIYMRAVNAAHDVIYRTGGMYLTWDADSYGTNYEHSITSTNGGGTWTDAITINSFGNIRMNIDSNNNGTNTFSIGQGTTGTGNTIFTLTEAGALTISAHLRCNEVWGDNGSATDPSFTFNSDQDTGMYRYGSNSLGFTTGGGFRARIESNGIHLASGDWFRSYGSTGGYNGTHGGGWYMIDSSWFRTYNNKSLYTGSGQIRSDAGNGFNGPNLTTTWSYNTLRWNSSNGDFMPYASLTEMKDDIVEINGVLGYLNERSLIYDLKPKIFREANNRVDAEGNPVYTTRGEYGHGMLAEEVLEVAPELAYFDHNGELLSYGNDALIPDIIAELQRMMPMLEELYAAAHPDWVPPSPRPPERAQEERDRYETARQQQALQGIEDPTDPLNGQRHLEDEVVD